MSVLDIATAFDRVREEYDPQPKPFAFDPNGWVREGGGFLWSKQIEIAESVRDNRFTACQSCHGAGKSYVASEIIAWWITTQPDPFVVTSAPTAHQVKSILWREVMRRHRDRDLPGYVTESNVPEWKINGELVAFGRKPADYVDHEAAASAFQGIHAMSVLVVLDEAAGIPKWLWTAAETLGTNEYSRILAIGNPTDPASEFAKVCGPGTDWNTIKISYLDLPAFTGEFVPAKLAKLLTGPMWVRERAKRWGVGSPLYIARVLGEFPEVSDDQLFSPALIRACQELIIPPAEHMKGARYGSDIADMGQDLTTVYLNRNGRIRLVDSWGKQDPMKTAGRLYKIVRPHMGAVPIVVDRIGVGSGVVARLKEKRIPVVPFNAAERANDPTMFKNRRSEQWWMMKELAENGLLDLPPDGEDDDLIAQIGAIKFDIDSSGRTYMEKKEETAKRVGASPDFADGAMMSTFKGSGLAEFLAEREPAHAAVPVPEVTAGLLEESF